MSVIGQNKLFSMQRGNERIIPSAVAETKPKQAQTSADKRRAVGRGLMARTRSTQKNWCLFMSRKKVWRGTTWIKDLLKYEDQKSSRQRARDLTDKLIMLTVKWYPGTPLWASQPGSSWTIVTGYLVTIEL